jgi:hypothetical protein
MGKRSKVLGTWDEPQHEPVTDPPSEFGDMSDEEITEAIKEWGGPYETRDIVEGVFAGVIRDDLIDDIVSELDSETDEWVPNSRRRLPDDDEEPRDLSNASEAFESMQQQVRTLEALLAEVPSISPGIGHNNPPESIEEAPRSHQGSTAKSAR